MYERSWQVQDPFGLNLTLYPDKGEKNLVTHHLLFKVQESRSCLSLVTGMCRLTVTLCNVTVWLHDQQNLTLGNLRTFVLRSSEKKTLEFITVIPVTRSTFVCLKINLRASAAWKVKPSEGPCSFLPMLPSFHTV